MKWILVITLIQIGVDGGVHTHHVPGFESEAACGAAALRYKGIYYATKKEKLGKYRAATPITVCLSLGKVDG